MSLAPPILLFLKLAHGVGPASKHNLLLLRVCVIVIGFLAGDSRSGQEYMLVAHKLPNGLFNCPHPVLNCGRSLGRFAQVARHLADAEAGGATAEKLLLFARELQALRLVFNAVAYTAVPELCNLIWHAMDWMGGLHVPVSWLRRLSIGHPNQAVYK